MQKTTYHNIMLHESLIYNIISYMKNPSIIISVIQEKLSIKLSVIWKTHLQKYQLYENPIYNNISYTRKTIYKLLVI